MVRSHQTVVITATFTAEPLEDSLSFWLQKLDIPSCIVFTPYNQLFQQLLDPTSRLSSNQQGINVVLVRFEDWERFAGQARTALGSTGDAGPNPHATLQRNVHDLIRALKIAASHAAAPYLICVCPASSSAAADAGRVAFFARMETLLLKALQGVSGMYVVSTAEMAALYPVATYYDPHTDALGHIPFTPSFYTALGTLIARKIAALQRAPYKVIVLDCDQTLWQGVCGEDGASGVIIDAPRRVLQAFMVAQHEAGMLLCLNSKNHEDDVWEVFAQHPEMPLQREHLLSWRINWRPKSENLVALAEELQLGLDSFIFLDDNPLECMEVQAHCPEVLVLQLPPRAEDIPQFLQHVWAFDHLRVTAEDKKRSLLYRQNVQRERFRQEALSFSSFLAGLNLDVRIAPPEPSQLPRVAQLTQRTNQFNSTTRKRSESDIQQFCQAAGCGCLVAEVSDRFGDYGLVAVVLFEMADDALTVDTLLMSCRVLGRGVEHGLLTRLGAMAQEHSLSWVKVPFIPTKKNQPARDFLESVGAAFQQPAPHGIVFQFPAAFAASLAYTPGETAPIALAETSEAESPAASMPTRDASAGQPVSILMTQIATELCDVKRIHRVIAAHRQRPRPLLDTACVEPRNAIEERVAETWQQVLGISPVGIHDNFLELGGNSLLATQVIARLYHRFHIELSMDSVFTTPTVAGLAATIATASEAKPGPQAPPLLPVSRHTELPLSYAQQRLWVLEQLTPGAAIYTTAICLIGTLNVAALQQGLNAIVQRHEVLRTTFASVAGRPVQVIAPSLSLALPVVDLSDVAGPQRQAEAQRLAAHEVWPLLSLTRGPLVHAMVLRLDTEEHLLVMAIHQIVYDGWSTRVLMRELATFYNACVMAHPPQISALPLQYADYAAWQRQWFEGEGLTAQLAYWRQQLGDAPPVLDLPTDRPRPAVPTFRGATSAFDIPAALSARLKTLSHREGSSLFMTLLAAFKMTLACYTGKTDIVVGSPVANRVRMETEELIGRFMHPLVLRTDLAGNPSFRTLLGRVRTVCLGAYAHQELPFELLVQALRPAEPDMHRMPMFQVLFTLDNDDLMLPTLAFAGLTLQPLESDDNVAMRGYDLYLRMRETERELVGGTLLYNLDLFEAGTIARLAGDFVTLLEIVVAQPAMRLREVNASLAEQHRRQQSIQATELAKASVQKLRTIRRKAASA